MGQPHALAKMPVGDMRLDGFSVSYPNEACDWLPEDCGNNRIVQSNVIKMKVLYCCSVAHS